MSRFIYICTKDLKFEQSRIHGSYEALDGGNLSDALVDFTGGVSELVSLENDGGLKLFEEEEKKNELYNRVFQEVERK